MKPQPNGVLRFNILQHARAPMFSLIRCNGFVDSSFV